MREGTGKFSFETGRQLSAAETDGREKMCEEERIRFGARFGPAIFGHGRTDGRRNFSFSIYLPACRVQPYPHGYARNTGRELRE